MAKSRGQKLAKNVRKQIKTLASNFSLEYNGQYFIVNFLKNENVVLLLFLMGRRLSHAHPYGSTVSERIPKIYDFLSSQIFKDLVAAPLGVVVEKSTLQTVLQKVKGDVQFRLQKLFKELKWGKQVQISKNTDTNLTVAVSEVSNAPESRKIKPILLHEWIHILLWSNGINFQKLGKEYWKEDEGLAKYLELYLEYRKTDLESIIRERLEKLPENGSAWKMRLYLEKALKWDRRLKATSSPVERKKRLLLQMDRKRDDA